MPADPAMGGTQAVRFGSSQALGKHDVTHKRGKYTTPAPGDYTVEGRHNLKFKASQTSAFGGNLCAVNREKTGLAAEGYRKMADPGPAHYSTTAANQAIKVKERAPTFNFGSSTRDDGAKAYMFRGDTSGTADPNAGNAGRGVPGPGQYGYGEIKSVKTKYPEYDNNLVLCLPPAQRGHGVTQWAAGVSMCDCQVLVRDPAQGPDKGDDRRDWARRLRPQDAARYADVVDEAELARVRDGLGEPREDGHGPLARLLARLVVQDARAERVPAGFGRRPPAALQVLVCQRVEVRLGRPAQGREARHGRARPRPLLQQLHARNPELEPLPDVGRL